MVLNLIKSAQEAGFSLDELRNLLPPDLQDWEHDKLKQALRDKVQSISELQAKLEHSKITILAVLKQIETKPEDLSCSANARRLMANLGLDAAEADALDIESRTVNKSRKKKKA